MCICRERNGKRTPKELETKRTGTNEHVSADVHFNTVETGFEQQLGFEKNRQSDLQKRLTQAEREIAQLRRHLQGAAAGCAQGFVKCFLRVPQAVGPMLQLLCYPSKQCNGWPVELSENFRNKLLPQTVLINSAQFKFEGYSHNNVKFSYKISLLLFC